MLPHEEPLKGAQRLTGHTVPGDKNAITGIYKYRSENSEQFQISKRTSKIPLKKAKRKPSKNLRIGVLQPLLTSLIQIEITDSTEGLDQRSNTQRVKVIQFRM